MWPGLGAVETLTSPSGMAVGSTEPFQWLGLAVDLILLTVSSLVVWVVC
jgi:hypothetical protein